MDTDTGVVRIVRCTGAHDSGTVINPLTFHGQEEGSIVMEVREVLTEGVLFDDDGKILDANLHGYLIPSIGDVPDIASTALQSHEPRGPYGAKDVAMTVRAILPPYRLIEAYDEEAKGQLEERFEGKFALWRGFVDEQVKRCLDCGLDGSARSRAAFR